MEIHRPVGNLVRNEQMREALKEGIAVRLHALLEFFQCEAVDLDMVVNQLPFRRDPEVVVRFYVRPRQKQFDMRD